MKNLVMIALLSGGIFSACGQTINASKVPSAVKAAFEKQYPNTKAKWEKEKGKYEVNFTQNGATMSALYEANGTLTETEMDIKVSELPVTAATYLKEHYAGKKVKEAAKITNADGSVNYEAEVSGKDVIFDVNGKFIREVKNNEKEEKD